MITVAGFNTAIDRRFRIEALHPGAVLRADSERIDPGGKGIHVAQAIAALGERVRLIGLVDAAHRRLITRRMSERGVSFHGIEIADELRTCIALQTAEGQVTEILGRGPQLDAVHREALLQSCQRALADSTLWILSGSLPLGLSATVYAELIMQAHEAGQRCLVDASGEVFRLALAARPLLVKPNRDEIAAWRGQPVNDIPAAAAAARELRRQGVALPVVSMGALGALVADGADIWHASIELDQVRNSVGSGDCLLAGMAVALKRGLPAQQALRLGVACGSANALNEESGFIERQQVEALLPEIRVERLR